MRGISSTKRVPPTASLPRSVCGAAVDHLSTDLQSPPHFHSPSTSLPLFLLVLVLDVEKLFLSFGSRLTEAISSKHRCGSKFWVLRPVFTKRQQPNKKEKVVHDPLFTQYTRMDDKGNGMCVGQRYRRQLFRVVPWRLRKKDVNRT